MSDFLKNLVDNFFIVYLDDILFSNQTKEEFLRHVRYVLERLQQEKFLINLKKCTFMRFDMVYLGFFILKDGLKMDLEKIEAILSWP